MSVQIEDLAQVDGLLIYGNWVEVESASLERYMPEHRSSSSTGVMYRWRHGAHGYLAMAADVKAVRIRE